MTRVPPDRLEDLKRHLAAEADLRGNADGVASVEELEALTADMQATHSFDGDAVVQPQAVRAATDRLLGATGAVETLSHSLRELPSELRRLALEIDGLWGNGDHRISVDELDRVASFYLAALPFFIKDASTLIDLADHLHLESTTESSQGDNLLALRAAMATRKEPDPADQAVRRIFDQAAVNANIPGAPALIRDPAFHNPEYHSFSIMRHTAFAVGAIRSLADAAGVEWKDAGAVMLLHDVGKMLTRHCVERDGKPCYSFKDHAEVGAAWLEHHNVDPELAFYVRNHELRRLSFEQIVAAAGDDLSRLRNLVLVGVADQVAKGVEPDQLASFREQQPKYRALAERAGIDFDVLLAARSRFQQQWYGADSEPPGELSGSCH